ncbi:MAG: trehalose-phosphatase [Pseudomonadota bacterium]
MTRLEDLQLGAEHALFLDFDGTLVEFGPDPDAIWLPEAMPAVLRALAGRQDGAVAVISGRDLRDLARRVPAGLWRAGGHGLEIVAPGERPPPPPPPPGETTLAPLRRVAERDGVRLELKGPVVALHYRAAPEAEADCLEAARQAAAPEGLVVQAGKCVVEVKPAGAHKGRALRRLSEIAAFRGRVPVMLGDDATDEDAIAEAQALGGIGVKIGAGETVARYAAPDPAAVRDWLRREAARSA